MFVCVYSVEQNNVFYSISGNKLRPFQPSPAYATQNLKRLITCSVHKFQVVWDPIYNNVKIC